MSLWQRSQACDCMKYFAGMFLPSLVCTELGKNLPLGPSPSPSMVSVGMRGFVTRLLFFQALLRVHQEPAAMPVTTRASKAKLAAAPVKSLPSQAPRVSHDVPIKRKPTA